MFNVFAFMRKFKQNNINKKSVEFSHHPSRMKTDSFRNFYNYLLCYLARFVPQAFRKFYSTKRGAVKVVQSGGFNSKNQKQNEPKASEKIYSFRIIDNFDELFDEATSKGLNTLEEISNYFAGKYWQRLEPL